MAIDWKAIKTEYITTNISQRELAKKYKVGARQLAERSKKEKWVEKRKQKSSELTAKMIDKATDEQVDRYARLMRVSDMALEIVERKIKACEDTEGIKTSDLRALTGAIRDLKEIQDCKGILDVKEQEARIDKLRADTEKDKEEVKAVSVIFKGVDEEWLK